MCAQEHPADSSRPVGPRPFDEKLDRESGVFIEPDAREVVTDDGRAGAPDDYAHDPLVREAPSPGTVDDLPDAFGEQVTVPNDEHLVPEGPTRPAGHYGEPTRQVEGELGAADEADLWRRQRALIEEDEKTGLDLEGFAEQEAARVLEAMGDDAADPLQDYPNGTSATGFGNEPDHGGFPERND
jgi:hypothetical protein